MKSLLSLIKGWPGKPSHPPLTDASTPARTLATVHLLTMVTATVLFALTWPAQRPGYNHEEIRSLALVLGIVAEATLAAGGFMGGAIVFAYGKRVLKRPDTPVLDALIPGRSAPEPPAAAPAASRETP